MARKMMVALKTFGMSIGARAPVRHKRTVIDRRTGEPKEIEMTDDGWGYADDGDEGVWHVIKEGQKLPASHEVVKAKPAYFEPNDDED